MMQAIAFFCNKYLPHILDIMVLSYIFYKIINFLQGTRAIQIMVGIFVLLSATILAKDVLDLRASAWILEKFCFAAIIIFAVIFQTEIRNFLAEIGSKVSIKTHKPLKLSTSEIVSAVEEMSKQKVGALIVIEQEIGLKNISKTGIIIDANISKELLLSIFSNKSAPLHDGAVVVHNNKIYSAGCVLPLSNDTEVKLFGTRHRAAIGLSEATDAIVIIVSEETGQISLAQNAKIEWDISITKLKNAITV